MDSISGDSLVKDERQADSCAVRIPGQYTLWAQAAGYFDGDGSVHLRTDSPVVLRFALVWIDNSFGQLLQLRTFLRTQGINLGGVLRHSENVCRLQVVSPKSALYAAEQMMPFCSKKHDELRTLVDYYEDRITGTEALSQINEAVLSGVRLGRIRRVSVLPTYREGKHRVARARGNKAAEPRRVSLI